MFQSVMHYLCATHHAGAWRHTGSGAAGTCALLGLAMQRRAVGRNCVTLCACIQLVEVLQAADASLRSIFDLIDGQAVHGGCNAYRTSEWRMQNGLKTPGGRAMAPAERRLSFMAMSGWSAAWHPLAGRSFCEDGTPRRYAHL